MFSFFELTCNPLLSVRSGSGWGLRPGNLSTSSRSAGPLWGRRRAEEDCSPTCIDWAPLFDAPLEPPMDLTMPLSRPPPAEGRRATQSRRSSRLCPHLLPICKRLRGAQQARNFPTSCNRLRRIASMFESVFISLGRSWRHTAVHPAAAVRHRWRLARVPAPRPGSASAAEVHGQLVSHPDPRI
jgi:hypothetical protein